MAPANQSLVTLQSFTNVDEGWRSLVDTFRNGKIKYDFRLGQIQTVFKEFGITID